MAEYYDIYAKMRGVPAILSDEMIRLDKHRQRISEDAENEQAMINEDYNASEIKAKNTLENKEKTAKGNFTAWDKIVYNYNQVMSQTHDNVSQVLGKALYPDQSSGKSVSVQNAIALLDEESGKRRRRYKKDDNQHIIELCRKETEIADDIQYHSLQIRKEATIQCEAEIAAARKQYSLQHDANVQKRNCELALADRKHRMSIEREEDEFVERIETILTPEKTREEYVELQYEQPNYEVFEPAEFFPAGIQFGYAGYDITGFSEDKLKSMVISSCFGYAVREANGRKYLTVPYGYAFTDNKFSTMFEFAAEERELAQENIRNLALNLFVSIPVNKCWCTFIDPVSLGATFAIFAPLGEKDASGNGDERAIDTRIWTDERQIEERLKLIVDHTSDVNFRCLQGRYDNILDYNDDAGINAEPLRFLMIMDFPNRFTDRALEYLESILDNGPKTGVYTIIAADKEMIDQCPKGSAVDRICSRIQNAVVSSGGVQYIMESTAEGPMRYFPFQSPKLEQNVHIIQEIQSHLGEEIIITYPMISENLPAKPDYWFRKSALDGISVPIGMEGAGKIVNLEFGGNYKTYNAMIGGTIGSGKTTLMHTIIQSILFNYDPTEVKLFLLDFKQGVEFKCYADYKLPHFKVVSIETEQEFGYAVLKELRVELDRRAKKFRSEGNFAHIEDYYQYKGARGEYHGMPRIVVIFDEIQALFSDENSEIVKKCVDLITLLATQGGNAFGMHLILSTQTFENVKGLGAGVYSNIHTRIALRSTKESAEILLGSDNEIANRLINMDPGQGVFNDKAGNKDSNRTFRAARISDAERDEWMAEVNKKLRENYVDEGVKPRILLSAPEDDTDNPLNVFAVDGLRPDGATDPSYHLYIGESLTMYNTYYPTLQSRKGQNLLAAGKDQEGSDLSRMIMGYTALSLLYETIRQKGEITEPLITVFDLSGSAMFGSEDLDMLEEIEAVVPEAFRIFRRNMILDGIETLYQELQSGRQQFVIFYGLNRAKQLTTGTYARSPKEMLEEMFARGPENGMHFIIWANDPVLFLENYKAALQSFDHRLAYGMDDEQYMGLTGEKGPDHSSSMNAMAYDQYGDNQKVRMYNRPSSKWLEQFLNNVRRFVK